MLGRSVTFRPESIEKRSQRGTLKNLTTPTPYQVRFLLNLPLLGFVIVCLTGRNGYY